MADPNDLERAPAELGTVPPREELLASDKDELVERVEGLARELKRRQELEEEILHLNFQRGTASLQAQFEEASRRFKVAQQELEAFRAEILEAEGGAVERSTPRPFVFENLDAPSAGGQDTGQLRALLNVFRRLRGERDRLRKEVEEARQEARQAHLAGEAGRVGAARSAEENAELVARHAALETDHERLQRSLGEAEAQIASLRMEQAQLRERLNLEKEQSGRLMAEGALLEESRADLERKLDVALRPPSPPKSAPNGYDLFQEFLQKARLREHLEKNIQIPPAPGRWSTAELLQETLSAIIGSQDRRIEPAKELSFGIVRPPKRPDLPELRQFIEEMPEAAVRGVVKVQDLLRATFTSLPRRPEGLMVDADFLEAAIGSRPRPNQVYWPLVCFVPELREFWQGELRTSAKLAPKDLARFISGSLARAPGSLEKSRLRVRMDARFFAEPVLRLLESKRCAYVIAAPDSPELRSEARRCSMFSEVAGGWEVGEIRHGLPVRRTQARIVVLRHPRPAQLPPSMPFLFRDPQYAYAAFVIDKTTTSQQALQCYLGRAEAAESEHAMLRDFCVNRLLGRGPHAHAKCFQLYLFASNLLQWFRRRALPQDRTL